MLSPFCVPFWFSLTIALKGVIVSAKAMSSGAYAEEKVGMEGLERCDKPLIFWSIWKLGSAEAQVIALFLSCMHPSYHIENSLLTSELENMC